MNLIVAEAVKVAGSQTKAAKACGVSRPLLRFWLNNERRISPEYVPALSAATNGKYQPHEIRPDLPQLFPHP